MQPLLSTRFARGSPAGLAHHGCSPGAHGRHIVEFEPGLHQEKKTSEDFDGQLTTKEPLLFTRYHHWDVVNRLINKTREEGPGKRYLIQLGAGSGKSNAIVFRTLEQEGLLAKCAGRGYTVRAVSPVEIAGAVECAA